MSATKEKKSKIQDTPDTANGKLKGKVYERELSKLHVELVKLQQWVVHKGLNSPIAVCCRPLRTAWWWLSMGRPDEVRRALVQNRGSHSAVRDYV